MGWEEKKKRKKKFDFSQAVPQPFRLVGSSRHLLLGHSSSQQEVRAYEATMTRNHHL